MNSTVNYKEQSDETLVALTLIRDEAAFEELGIRGFWNFTGQELELEDAIIENVHLGDSLMALCYKLCSPQDEKGDD